MPAHNSILRNNFGSTASWNEGSEYSEHLADDDLDEVVMAVNAGSNGLFGCSYFTAQEQKLSLMSDVRNGNFEILDCRTYFSIPFSVLCLEGANADFSSQSPNSTHANFDALSNTRACGCSLHPLPRR